MLNFLAKSKYILGLNSRNLNYLYPLNFKRAVLIADNKLTAKEKLKKAGLPVLQTYNIIRTRQDLEKFDWFSLPKSFTLKPNRGYGGNGILTVYGKKKNQPDTWVLADRGKVSVSDLKNHIWNILEGNFSLIGLPDIAFFEERSKVLKLFKPYSFRGIPDIRIIVFNKTPIMAELRLPTQDSGGRANLHQGGIGVGIDIGSGITTHAIQYDKTIESYPDSRLSLRGIKIPYWKDILGLTIEAQNISQLGLAGIDIVIDRDKGPIILEINARPGLSIQNANLAPLSERLKRIEGLKIKSIKKGVRVAQELFGGEVEEELEEISGRRVIGINEPVEIFDSQNNKHLILCKIDTGAFRTAISQNLAEQLGLNQIIKVKKVKSALGLEERAIIRLSFLLDKRLVETEAFMAERGRMKYDLIIGRRDLKKFLVDPAKNIFMSQRVLDKIKEKRGIEF